MLGETDRVVTTQVENGEHRRPPYLDSSSVEFEVPWRTIVRLLFAATLVWAFLHLRDLLTVVAVAVILAVTIRPVIEMGERHGVRRGVGALLMGLIVFAIVAAAGGAAAPMLSEQAHTLGTRLSSTLTALRAHLPPPFDELLQQQGNGAPRIANVASY